MHRNVILVSEEQIESIWAQWDELAVLTSSPYCCPAWMMAWWRHVAPSTAQLRVVAVFDGADLLGVAPFFVDRGLGGVRRYRLLGAGTSAPLGIIARSGAERMVASVTARSLAEAAPQADVIMLEGVRGSSPWPELLCELWPAPGKLRTAPQFSQRAPYIQLAGGTYEEWFAARSANFRSNMRRGRKEMQKHGGTIRLATNPQALARDLEAFAILHRLRWHGRGGSGVLDAGVERMLADAGAQMIEQGRFRVWSIEVEGRTISSQIFVVAGGEAAYWLGGFDPEAPRIRKPGILTILAAVEHAFAAGETRLDLGAGGQRYKYDFSQAADSLNWILLIPPGRRALLARAQLARIRWRITLAHRMSPRAKQVVRRALGWAARFRGN